jgi:8-hydroxy-5-deazaflavin:NADPH oxidoreductase
LVVTASCRPTEGVSGKVVIDTNNYYPQRDGHFEESTAIEPPRARGCKHTWRMLVWSRPSTRFSGRACATTAAPLGIPSGSVFPISGDEEEAKRTVAALIDQIGFDPVDAGTLAEGGSKHQTGAPGYTQGLPTAELRALLAA